MIATILIYFLVLLAYSRWATGRNTTNDTFFRGNRRSPWYMVAFGMVGASISGITFVSVPGMVMHSDMTYLQTCLGFILGYITVAYVLLPIYYRLNLTTIYSYLNDRLGKKAYKTGATFFLLSKMTGAAARFYVVCMLLQTFVFDGLNIPFIFTVMGMVTLIWLYTRHGGIKTLVWTDTFQTTCMFTALILIIVNVASALGMTIPEDFAAVFRDSHSHTFVFDDFLSRQNFWKQFLSGIFIVIVMTGLDQDMMQKNLTCKNLREAQKDMCTYGIAFVPANLLFLCLGVMLTMLCTKSGTPLPESSDQLLPMFAASGVLGTPVIILFTIGIMAASFSSADSALTALTTSYCVDIKEDADNEKLRRHAHLAMAILFTVCILLFRLFNSTSLIDAIYIMCSYTYGPLLGLFAFALFTKRSIAHEHYVLPVAIASPLLCFALDTLTTMHFNYHFGYELLMVNGALTFLGLYSISRNAEIA